MTAFIFNISKGSFIEKLRDDPTKVLVLLLKVAEVDDTLNNYATLATLLAGANTEADFTSYARKTGITATITVDNATNLAYFTIPSQTWSPAGGATNNAIVKAVVAYEESAADSGRVPIACSDWPVTTDGNPITLQYPSTGVGKAA